MNTATLSGSNATLTSTNPTPPNANGRLSETGGDVTLRNQDLSAVGHPSGLPQPDSNKPDGTQPGIANRQGDATKPGEPNKAADSHAATAPKTTTPPSAAAAKSAQLVATASNEMTNLRADLDNLIGRIPHLAEAELSIAKETLLQKYGQGKKTITDATAVVRETVTHGVVVAGDYVKERPLKTVAVTAGIGILLGMLISRSR